MTDDNQTRRNVLKAAGSISLATTGVASAADGDNRSVEKSEFSEVTDLESVRSVYRVLGEPAVRAKQKITQRLSSTVFTLHTFATKLGTLRVIDPSDRGPVAHFVCETLSESPMGVSSEYRDVFTAESASLYSGPSGSVEFVRSVPEQEKRAVTAQTALTNPDEVVFLSEAGGYAVQELDESQQRAREVLVRTETGDRSVELSESTTTIVTPDEVNTNCESGDCWQCLSWILGGVVTCGGICAAVSWTIAGIVACVGCLITAGVIVSFPCRECYNTC